MKRKALLFAAFCVALAAMFFAPVTGAAADTVDPESPPPPPEYSEPSEPLASFEPHGDGKKSPKKSSADSVSAASETYWFATRGDYVHESGLYASGHGWWDNLSGPPGYKANVDVQLQVYEVANDRWYNVGPKFSKDVWAGGGSGNRTTAKVLCRRQHFTYWRSVIDVDIIGASDPDNKLYTPYQMLSCSP